MTTTYHQITNSELAIIEQQQAYTYNSRRLKSAGIGTLSECKALLSAELLLTKRYKSEFDPSSKAHSMIITFITKDMIQRHYAGNDDSEYVDEAVAQSEFITPVASNERLTAYEAARISELFLPKSQEFVKTLLTYGDDTTKELMGLSTKRLNEKAGRQSGYVKKHPDKFSGLVIRNIVKDKEESVMAANHFFNLVDMEADGQQLSNYINIQLDIENKLFEDALDATRFSSIILDDFYAAPKADQYAFCDTLSKQSKQLWSDTGAIVMNAI